MKYRLSLRHDAEREALEAHDYYEAQEPGLGKRFHDEMAGLLGRLQENPHLYPISEKSPYRKAAFHQFPFCLYYCVLPEKVVIIAVHDCRRHPDRWKSRG